MARSQAEFIEAGLRSDDEATRNFYRMVKDLGGTSKFWQLMDSDDDAAKAATHQAYGLQFSKEDPDAALQKSTRADATHAGPNDPYDCPRFYPPEYRGKTFLFGTYHAVIIDGVGRPFVARWRGGPSLPVVAAPRYGCATIVGTWGLPTDVGGHMVPAALGGWGGRANVVPMDRTLNASSWRIVESVPAQCRKTRMTTYEVAVLYSSAADVRPLEFFGTVVVEMFFPPQPITIGTARSPNVPPTPNIVAGFQNFKNMATLHCPPV